MSSIISFISILNYLADFINFIFILFLSFIIFIIINKNFEINLIKKNKITKLFYYEFFIFSLLLLTPFLVNNFLIDWWQFPDQAKYFNQTYDERTFSARDNFYLGVYYVSKIYAYFPIPFLETFISISLINRFLFLIIIYYIYKKNIISLNSVFFIMLTPSLILYTSVALKESVVYFFLFLSILFFIKKKYFSLITTISIIFFLNYKLSYIISSIFFFYYFFFYLKISNSLKIVCLIIFFHFLFIFNDELFNYLIKLKRGFLAEEMMSKNINREILQSNEIKEWVSLIIGSPLFFFKSLFGFYLDLLNDGESFIKLLLYTFDLVIIFYLFFNFINKNFIYNKKKIFFFLITIYLLLSCTGFIITNINTQSRYNLTLMLFIFFLMITTCKINNVKK